MGLHAREVGSEQITVHEGTPLHSRYCLPEDGGTYRIFGDVLLGLDGGDAYFELAPHPGLDDIQRRKFYEAWRNPERKVKGALRYLDKPSRRQRSYKEVAFLREWLRRREALLLASPDSKE